jgi:hypothetical protein
MTDVLLTLVRSLSSIVKPEPLSKSRSLPSVTKSTRMGGASAIYCCGLPLSSYDK